MKLIRVGPFGGESPGVLVSGGYVDVSEMADDFAGQSLTPSSLNAVEGLVAERLAAGRVLSLEGKRLGAPIGRPQQIVCIGLNYADHAAETGQDLPSEPIVFTKAPNTVVGPNDDIQIPRRSIKTDWEVELGVVMGSTASYLADEAAAAACIAGYVAVNDVSEREFQLERGGQWVKGKSCPTFNPAGPYLVTPEEVGDVVDLDMWLDVDGVRRQSGSTAKMVFSPAYLVWYLSQFMRLEPGDLVNTGTPPGVGMGMDPPSYLTGGETVELGIKGLGRQRNRVLPWPGAG